MQLITKNVNVVQAQNQMKSVNPRLIEALIQGVPFVNLWRNVAKVLISEVLVAITREGVVKVQKSQVSKSEARVRIDWRNAVEVVIVRVEVWRRDEEVAA